MGGLGTKNVVLVCRYSHARHERRGISLLLGYHKIIDGAAAGGIIGAAVDHGRSRREY